MDFVESCKIHFALQNFKQSLEISSPHSPLIISIFHLQVKVAKTVLLLIGVYIITWIPILVIHFLRMARMDNIPDSVDLAAAFLMSVSCVTNPWICHATYAHEERCSEVN